MILTIPSTSWWKKHPYKLFDSNLFSTGRAFTLSTYSSLDAILAKNMTTPSWHFFYQRTHAYWTVEDRLLWRFGWLFNTFLLKNKYPIQKLEFQSSFTVIYYVLYYLQAILVFFFFFPAATYSHSSEREHYIYEQNYFLQDGY